MADLDGLAFGPNRCYELVAERWGGLQVWQAPEPRHEYVVGIDSAEGVRGGDYSAAAVLDMATCDLVALWRGHYDPHLWGARQMPALGAWYNNALLAFEAHVSAHGYSALQSCIAAGYGNLWMRMVEDRVVAEVTEKPGWATTARTKPMMIDAVRRALRDAGGAEGFDIPAEVVLRECRALRYNQNNPKKVETPDHDDTVDAYAIALLVRDAALYVGMQPKRPDKPRTDTDRHWDDWETETAVEHENDGASFFDGC